PQRERNRFLLSLRNRLVKNCRRGFTELVVFRVSGNAHDFNLACVRRVMPKPTADWILVWKEFSRCCFVEDGDSWRIATVSTSEITAEEDWNSHRGKEIRRDTNAEQINVITSPRFV